MKQDRQIFFVGFKLVDQKCNVGQRSSFSNPRDIRLIMFIFQEMLLEACARTHGPPTHRANPPPLLTVTL